MATNIVTTTVYQINQKNLVPTGAYLVGFPTQGCILTDCTASPTRALSNTINVYCAVQVPNGDKYYVVQTIAQMATLFNA